MRRHHIALLALSVASLSVGAQPEGLDVAVYEPPVVPELAADGSTVVALTIRANGEVEDAVALYATHAGLARAAVEAVRQWRFARDPVEGRGRNARPDLVLRRELVEFDFRRKGVVSSLSHAESTRGWFPETQEPAVRTVLRYELPRAPRRLASSGSDAAAAEDAFSRVTAAGRATVSFVIDEEGRVRVPLVVAADEPSLGEAALALVRTWRFEPTTVDGRTILVEDRRTFTFDPPSK